MYNGVTDTRSKADFRMYRDMLHVSQQVMGHMLGYSRAAVADWEDPAAWVPGRDAWERLLRRWRRAEKKAMALVDLSAGVDRPVLPYRIRARDGVGDTMIWHFENLASRLAWDELRRSGVEAGVTRPGADPGDPSLADASMLGLRMDLLCLPQSTLADLAGVTRGRLQSWRSGTGPRPESGRVGRARPAAGAGRRAGGPDRMCGGGERAGGAEGRVASRVDAGPVPASGRRRGHAGRERGRPSGGGPPARGGTGVRDGLGGRPEGRGIRP